MQEEPKKFIFKRTPEEREASKERARAARLAKTAKKEGVVLREVGKAAKKARDFLIRKLKRRLVLLERAEQQKTEGDKDSNGLGKDASASERKAEAFRPKFERGTKEGISKQLLVAQQSNLTQAAKQLGIRGANSAGEDQAGDAEMPALDEPLRLFVAQVLQQKCVKVEMAEGQEKINILNAKNDKWERSRTKFNLKSNAKAAARAEKAQRIADGLEPPDDPSTKEERPLTKKERRRLKVIAKGRLNKQTKSRVTRKEQLKKRMKKERKVQRQQKLADGSAKRGREEGGGQSQAAQPLHPSWAAKKQQKMTIDQTAPSKAKKVVFEE